MKAFEQMGEERGKGRERYGITAGIATLYLHVSSQSYYIDLHYKIILP